MAALAFMFAMVVVLLAVAFVLVAVLLRIILPLFLLLGVLCACIAAVGLYPASILWAYLDAEARGKPGWAVALLVGLSPFFALIGWPLALLAWVVFRPEKKTAAPAPASGPLAGAFGPS